MGPIWGRQDPGGPHNGPMNFAIWDSISDNIILTVVWLKPMTPDAILMRMWELRREFLNELQRRIIN